MTRSDGPKVKYKYSKKDKDDEMMLRISRVEYPENRFLDIFYSDKGKVAFLKALVGADEKPITTHRFHYHEKHTSVYDALENKTVYHFQPEKNRINYIEYYDGESLHHSERFIWEKNDE